METKDFLDQIEAMVQRAFDKLEAEYPKLDFRLYTLLIHIDFVDLEPPKEEGKKKRKAIHQRSRAICCVSFDDVENSYRCAEILAASMNPKDESRFGMERTYNPEDSLLKNVECMEFDDLDTQDVVDALKTYERCSKMVIATTVRAKTFEVCYHAEMVILFKQRWLRAIYYYFFAIYDGEASNKTSNFDSTFDKWWRIACTLIVLFVAYKVLF
jgi:hypothetical protein